MEESITREILWNIPKWFEYGMYLILIITCIVLIYGLYQKYKFVIGKETPQKILPEKLNIEGFIRTLFIQGKIVRDKPVGLFHGMIFFGFIGLLIATTVVAIHFDTPFKIFKGDVYKIISLLADVGGAIVLVGVIIAAIRRWGIKPDYLSVTDPSRDIFMHLMIVNLVIGGFLLEGIRIQETGMPAFEQTWSPLGYYLAIMLTKLGLSSNFWSITHKIIWFEHFISAMIFIAALASTKFLHILLSPINALLTPRMRGAVINPMSFEDEDAETFGLAKTSELTIKNKLDLISCVECGRCTKVCPALESGKDLDPKTIITKLRDIVDKTKPNEKGVREAGLWENEPIFKNNELDACTTCGACMLECPMSIEHVQLITDLKRYKVLTLGEVPPAGGDTIRKIGLNHNPWGIAHNDRLNWALKLDVQRINAGESVDYLYFVGCAGSYDPLNQKVVADTVNLFKIAGLNFAIMSDELCCADPVRRLGDEYTFYELALENITRFNQYKFKQIVTHCPHCLHTLGKEYQKIDDGKFEVIHHTTLLNQLIKNGRLKPSKPVDEILTFHDPCYLGRHHEEYSAPREILKTIPGLTLKEMKKVKDRAVCCGMGGGNMWYELPEGEHLAIARLKNIGETKTSKVATACSYCMINFDSSKGRCEETEELAIQDVASILNRSIE